MSAARKLEDNIVQSVTSGFTFGFVFWSTVPFSLLGNFVYPFLVVHVISTINKDSASRLRMGRSSDAFDEIWNQFIQAWVHFQMQSFRFIGRWRMIMLVGKLEDKIFESMSSGFTLGFVLWSTIPDSLLRYFGYPFHVVHVISTINNDSFSPLWLGCSSDAFNVIWNQFFQV